MSYRRGGAANFVVAVCLIGMAMIYQSPIARAESNKGVAGAAPSVVSRAPGTTARVALPAIRHARANHRYFVEFRARNAASYGHLYILYGEVNDREEIIKSRIAGFFPAGDTRDCENCSVYNWTIGHVFFVPSELGASDGDLEEKYVLARYRVWVDEAEYKRISAYIEQKKLNKPLWNALWKNCVDFGREMAEFMNLKVPLYLAAAPSIWLYPKDFVTALREANGVETEQAPLKDASASSMVSTDPTPSSKPPLKPKVEPIPTAHPSPAKPARTSHKLPATNASRIARGDVH